MDPKQQEQKKEERVPIKSLRTYQGDVDELMSKNKYSATTILVAEQKRKLEAPPSPRIPEKPINVEARNKFFTILGITLLLIGGLTIAAVYYTRASEQTVIMQQTKAILPFSDEHAMNIASSSRDVLLTRIVTEQKSFKFPINSVLFINTTKSETASADVSMLLRLLGPNMPASLERSFENRYMLGIYAFETNEPFLILTTKDYPSAYAGMLRWEKDMPDDLGKMFSIPDNTSSTTPAFSDESIRNKDLRILKDQSNKTVLIYSFIDKNTLVITKNESIFNAILAKYLTNGTTR